MLVIVPLKSPLVAELTRTTQSIETPLLVAPGMTTNRASMRSRFVRPEAVPVMVKLPVLS